MSPWLHRVASRTSILMTFGDLEVSLWGAFGPSLGEPWATQGPIVEPLGRQRSPFYSISAPTLTPLGGFLVDVCGKLDPYKTCTGMSGLHVCAPCRSHFGCFYRLFGQCPAWASQKTPESLQGRPMRPTKGPQEARGPGQRPARCKAGRSSRLARCKAGRSRSAGQNL